MESRVPSGLEAVKSPLVCTVRGVAHTVTDAQVSQLTGSRTRAMREVSRTGLGV